MNDTNVIKLLKYFMLNKDAPISKTQHEYIKKEVLKTFDKK